MAREKGNRKDFLQIVEMVLKQDKRLVAEDGALLKSKAYDLGIAGDAGLLKLLLHDRDTKEHFFQDIDGIQVFDSMKFGWVVTSKAFLPDSYTSYKNKLGLADRSGRILSQSKEVCLVWPYKDCILEGGQTKEDQKREEIFYNETLAPDEVNRLLYPKVLTNAKRYTADGAADITQLNDEDNLIVQGNNLLALSSLLRRYESQVKCIYIDPPYNTGSDSFHYNDNFKHSTWLLFTKNRMDMAYRLLADDGAVFVHIDYHELGYIIPIMDEIFGKENCVQVISVKTSSPAGFKTVNPGPIDVTEYILFYTKNRRRFAFKKMYVPTSYDSNYDLYIENIDDTPDKWRLEKLYNVVYRENGVAVGETAQQSNKNAKEKWGEYWKTVRESLMADFALKNADRVVSIRDPQKPTQELKSLLAQSKTERNKIFVYEKAKGENSGYVINGGSLSFYANKVKELDGVLTATELLTDLWQDISWDGIAREGGVTLKNGKKPEKLLRRIIEMSTEAGDIVMDYHLGSGTTCAVAHKLGRQYIGIEQLDYGNDDSLVRLQNVIKGEAGGISKAVNWQGGGSFVYFELKKLNEQYMERAQAAATEEEILVLLEEIKQSGFISQKVKPSDIDTGAKEYAELTLADKRRLLAELINKNLLYVNLCDRDDEEFHVTEAEKAFTNSFYGRR